MASVFLAGCAGIATGMYLARKKPTAQEIRIMVRRPGGASRHG